MAGSGVSSTYARKEAPCQIGELAESLRSHLDSESSDKKKIAQNYRKAMGDQDTVLEIATSNDRYRYLVDQKTGDIYPYDIEEATERLDTQAKKMDRVAEKLRIDIVTCNLCMGGLMKAVDAQCPKVEQIEESIKGLTQ